MLLFWVFNDNCDNAICELSEGNINALSVIYRNYGKMIFSLGYQIVNNKTDAEDVLQETMLNIAKYAHTYRRGTNPKAWVLAITRNCAISIVKKRGNTLPLDDIELSIADPADDIDDIMAIRDAMQKLNEQERAIINLKLHIGLSHAEIASVLGTNAIAVQKRYRRALEKLKRYYEE